MKIINIWVILILSLLTLGCNSYKTEYEIGDVSYLKIGTNITKQELTKICAEFKSKKNIKIDFSKSKFNSKGKISEINIDASSNTSNSSTNFNFYQSPFNSRVGFKISTDSYQYGDVQKINWSE